MRRLLVVANGAAPEERLFRDRRLMPYVSETVYLPDLPRRGTRGIDILLVPEGSDRRRLAAATGVIGALLERGGTVVTFGDQQSDWLPGADWTFRSVADASGLEALSPDHPFHREVWRPEAAWHHHGILDPPPGAQVLLATEDGRAVAYIDEATTKGVIVAATVDPIAHAGRSRLPSAFNFFERFLAWITKDDVR